MNKKYTFIFEISWRDFENGRFRPCEYRKRCQMSIESVRRYARRLSNLPNVLNVRFYKEMF